MKTIMFTIMGIALSTALVTQSCNHDEPSIEEMIARYDRVDFNSFRDRTVQFRSSGHSANTAIFLVGAYHYNCLPYVVEYDLTADTVVTLSNNLVLESCKRDYISEKEVRRIVQRFVKLRLTVLIVDKDGNVYFNPNRQDRPLYLKRALGSIASEISDFHQYRDNWYIRRK